MHQRLLAWLGLVALTLGCARSAQDSMPEPPPSPELARSRLEPPPGTGDYARRHFPRPLAVADAEAILTRTEIFEFGEMPPKRQVQAFNVVFEQPDAARRFQRIGKNAQPAGRLYAVAGLLLLDHSAGEHLLVVLSNSPERILMFDSDVVSRRTVRDVAALVRDRNLGLLMRASRDRTEAYFRAAG